MVGNFIIGLREGVEASLVIGVLVAYVLRLGQRSALRQIWFGVGLAIAASLATAGIINLTASELPETFEQTFTGIMSVVAVGMVTWMVLWMRRASRTISGRLRSDVDAALVGGSTALVLVSFVAVAREGLESALFLWAASRTVAGSGSSHLIGAIAGFAVAALIGYVLFLGMKSINISAFFRVSGIALIFLAAGVAGYAVHEFQEVGLLPGLNAVAFDFSNSFAESTTAYAIFNGITGIRLMMTWPEVITYGVYAALVLAAFLRPVPQPVVAREPELQNS